MGTKLIVATQYMIVTGSVLWTSSGGGARFEFWTTSGGGKFKTGPPKVHLSGFPYSIDARVGTHII